MVPTTWPDIGSVKFTSVQTASPGEQPWADPGALLRVAHILTWYLPGGAHIGSTQACPVPQVFDTNCEPSQSWLAPFCGKGWSKQATGGQGLAVHVEQEAVAQD